MHAQGVTGAVADCDGEGRVGICSAKATVALVLFRAPGEGEKFL